MDSPSLSSRLIRRIQSRFLPSCREMTRLASRHLDGGVPLHLRPGMFLHRWVCRGCRCYESQLRWLRRMARQPEPDPAVRGRLSAAAKARLKEALRYRCGPARR